MLRPFVFKKKTFSFNHKLRKTVHRPPPKWVAVSAYVLPRNIGS